MPCARAGLEAPISISVPRALRSPSPVALGASCRRVLRRVLLGGTAGAVLCSELGGAGARAGATAPAASLQHPSGGCGDRVAAGCWGRGNPHLCQTGRTPRVGSVGGGWELGNYC